MGYSLIKKNHHRWIIFLLLVGSMTVSFLVTYPFTSKKLQAYSIPYYHYNPKTPVVSEVDTSHMPPAVAVPILLYHGVIYGKSDNDNTTLAHFQSDMEMLKREGYQTITISQYDLFRLGLYTLPPKPIIITFDDGRKDSYYTTDDIFKKLGFTATLFDASGPTIDGNTFYLTWDEMRTMVASGRWDIEAHGRYSHSRVPITKATLPEDQMGRYLSSRMYLAKEGRLETIPEFEQRVEADYVNSINDIKNNLDIDPKYFAVPFNDYGQESMSNYDDAPAFNEYVTQKYFRMAFIQANDSQNVNRVVYAVYNFKNDDPYRLRRIEMKDMPAETLLQILNDRAPIQPSLSYTPQSISAVQFDQNLVIGTVASSTTGLALKANNEGGNGRVVFGKTYWTNYNATTSVQRDNGRSVSLLMYYQNSSQYLTCGFTDNSYFLRSVIGGVTTDLVPPVLGADISTATTTYAVQAKNDVVSCSVNGTQIFSNVPLPAVFEQGGMVGVNIWGDGVTSATVHSLDVTSL